MLSTGTIFNGVPGARGKRGGRRGVLGGVAGQVDTLELGARRAAVARRVAADAAHERTLVVLVEDAVAVGVASERRIAEAEREPEPRVGDRRLAAEGDRTAAAGLQLEVAPEQRRRAHREHPLGGSDVLAVGRADHADGAGRCADGVLLGERGERVRLGNHAQKLVRQDVQADPEPDECLRADPRPLQLLGLADAQADLRAGEPVAVPVVGREAR